MFSDFDGQLNFDVTKNILQFNLITELEKLTILADLYGEYFDEMDFNLDRDYEYWHLYTFTQSPIF